MTRLYRHALLRSGTMPVLQCCVDVGQSGRTWATAALIRNIRLAQKEFDEIDEGGGRYWDSLGGRRAQRCTGAHHEAGASATSDELRQVLDSAATVAVDASSLAHRITPLQPAPLSGTVEAVLVGASVLGGVSEAFKDALLGLGTRPRDGGTPSGTHLVQNQALRCSGVLVWVLALRDQRQRHLEVDVVQLARARWLGPAVTEREGRLGAASAARRSQQRGKAARTLQK